MNTLLCKSLRSAACVLALATCAQAMAVTKEIDGLSYDLKGVVSGTLNGVAFTDRPFELTGSTEPGWLTVMPKTTNLLFSSATVEIQGVGGGTVTEDFGFSGLKYLVTRRDTTYQGGFSGVTADLIYFSSPLFNGAWNYTTPLAATPVTATYLDGGTGMDGTPVATTAGPLVFTSAQDLVFQVSSVPESPAWLLMLAGLVIVARRAWASRPDNGSVAA